MRGLWTRYPELPLVRLSPAMKRMCMLRGQLWRISALLAEDLVGRVLHQLTYLAPAGTSGYDKRITQAVIASYSGLSREVVNKTMRDFESRGLVRLEEDGVHVTGDFAATDFGALPREAETAVDATPAPLVEFADSTAFVERRFVGLLARPDTEIVRQPAQHQIARLQCLRIGREALGGLHQRLEFHRVVEGLEQHPEIVAAVVLVHGQGDGDKLTSHARMVASVNYRSKTHGLHRPTAPRLTRAPRETRTPWCARDSAVRRPAR